MGRQTGCIFKSKNGQRWFARWREDVIEDGQVRRKLRFRDLAPVCDAYRREKDVQPLLDEILGPVNAGKARPESTLSVYEYGETYWLPWVRENCKPSTVAGYTTIWKLYLAPNLQKITLRDFRTADAKDLFAAIHRQKGKIGRTTLSHCKRRLSSIFALAINDGALVSANPIIGAWLPKSAAAPARTHAATPDEVMAILDVLGKAREIKARTAVGMMFFAGLRPGEARGARWEDYDGKRIFVRQSIWHTHTTTPKTEDAESPVPVIESLRTLLEETRIADGNPTVGPILRGPSGKPMNLDNLSKRVMMPLLKNAGMEWHGWYSLRRGVATALAGLSKDPLASKGLLRHSSLATTQRHYIKNVPANTLSAMDQLESLFNDCSTPGTVRPN